MPGARIDFHDFEVPGIITRTDIHDHEVPEIRETVGSNAYFMDYLSTPFISTSNQNQNQNQNRVYVHDLDSDDNVFFDNRTFRESIEFLNSYLDELFSFRTKKRKRKTKKEKFSLE